MKHWMNHALRLLLVVAMSVASIAQAGQLTINRGTTAGDGTGETLYSAFGKVNDNFNDIYTNYSIVGVKVKAPTGNPATDLANIQSAITAAGTGGLVQFPAGATYTLTRAINLGGVPIRINGNGATIKRSNELSTATSSTIVNGSSSPTVTVTSSSGFVVGDSVCFVSATENSTNVILPISAIVGNSVTVSGTVNTRNGTSLVNPSMTRCFPQIYSVQASGLNPAVGTVSQGKTVIENIELDGNSSNNTTVQKWELQQAIFTAVDNLTVRGAHIFNAPGDGVANNGGLSIEYSGNVLENIRGNGFHPGGVGTDMLRITGNTLRNTNIVTTNTSSGYGHVNGAVMFSNQVKRSVFANNVVDTSGARCFGDLQMVSGTGDQTFVLEGNIGSNCAWGAFGVSYTSGTSNAELAVTGNVFRFNGSSTLGYGFTTSLYGGALKSWTASGNTFVDTPMYIQGGSNSGGILSGNSMTVTSALTAGTYQQAAVTLASTSSNVSIVGNAVDVYPSNTGLHGIWVNGGNQIGVQSNKIYGGNVGIRIDGGPQQLLIAGNDVTDSYNQGIYLNLSSSSAQGCAIKNNNVTLSAGALSFQTAGWAGILYGSRANMTVIDGNTVNVLPTTGWSYGTGIAVQTNASTDYMQVTDNRVYAAASQVQAMQSAGGSFGANQLFADNSLNKAMHSSLASCTKARSTTDSNVVGGN